MTKSEAKQVKNALSLLHIDARYAAVSLATMQRCAGSKTRDEISKIIGAHPGLSQHLDVVNGCYVERS